jgi:hypothetical protein
VPVVACVKKKSAYEAFICDGGVGESLDARVKAAALVSNCGCDRPNNIIVKLIA